MCYAHVWALEQSLSTIYGYIRIDIARSQHPLVRDKVREKLSETISKMGISPESGHAMKFFHMSYKASYHLGFKIAQSSMLLRPYVQKSIFSIGISENNPYQGNQFSRTYSSPRYDDIIKS